MPQESLNLPYLTLTGVVLLTIVASFLLYKPQIEQLRTMKASIVELTQKLDEKQKFLQSIDQKSAALAANAAAEQELNIVLPPDESFDDLLRIIDRQAGTAAIRVESINNTSANTQSAQRVAAAIGKDITTPSTLTTHSVDMSIQGSYQQIRQFIGLLENAVRFMDISSLGLRQATDQPDLLDGTISAKFYSLTPP